MVRVSSMLIAVSLLGACTAIVTAEPLPPDLVVAADGSGDFTSVQQAVASIPKENAERVVVLVKDGVYREKVRIDASFVTLRGESRKGTRIEFPQLDEDFKAKPDDIGRAVVNLEGSDAVFENLTIHNTAGVVGPHAFAILGRGDRTVIIDCDVLSEGADTVALWRGRDGRYYHARCHFRGAVDFVCPRGWCYIEDSTFYETKATAALWHDGRHDKDMKFVLRNCQLDGVPGWVLARHHVDAQFYLLDCTFSSTMIDRPPKRVIYPIGDKPVTEADVAKNAENDKLNLHGERAYFDNCHRDGGDFAWHADNLATAEGSPTRDEITPAWTFAGTWDPERTDGPRVIGVERSGDSTTLVFSERVTVKGKPRLAFAGDGVAAGEYATGSGSDRLVFNGTGDPASLDLAGSAIIASEAGATTRHSDVKLPAAE